jgi:hypothetical protein
LEIPQGNCVVFFVSNKLKCHFKNLFSFFFYKIRDEEGGTGPAQGGELAPVEGRR